MANAGRGLRPPIHLVAWMLAPAASPGSDGRGQDGSLSQFVAVHGSGSRWRESVWEGYFQSSGIILPAALSAGALLALPFDHQLYHQWADSLGGKANIGDVGLATVAGASFVL